jgi:apolipoprotein N-acyltransferase
MLAASAISGLLLSWWLTLLVVVVVAWFVPHFPALLPASIWAAWFLGAYAFLFKVSVLAGLLAMLLLVFPSLLAARVRRFRPGLLCLNFAVPMLLSFVGLSWVSPGIAFVGVLDGVVARAGVVGVEMLLAVVAVFTYRVSTRQGATPFAVSVSLALVVALGLALVPVPPAEPDSLVLDAAVVQPQKTMLASLGAGDDLASAMGALMAEPTGLDVAVLPEALTSEIVLDRSPERSSLTGVSDRLGGAVLVTGFVDSALGRNSVLVSRGGIDLARYDKRNLVPGTERRFDWLPVAGSWSSFSPGRASPQPTSAGSWSLGAMICYDLGDATLARVYRDAGAGMLTVSSSVRKLGWQVGMQQVFLARARALESGLPVLLSSRGGPSSIVQSDGSVYQNSRATVVRTEVVLGSAGAPASSWWAYTCFVLLMVVSSIPSRLRFRIRRCCASVTRHTSRRNLGR